jgi:hypothetical protein
VLVFRDISGAWQQERKRCDVPMKQCHCVGFSSWSGGNNNWMQLSRVEIFPEAVLRRRAVIVKIDMSTILMVISSKLVVGGTDREPSGLACRLHFLVSLQVSEQDSSCASVWRRQ